MKYLLTIFLSLFIFSACSEKEKSKKPADADERLFYYVDKIKSLESNKALNLCKEYKSDKILDNITHNSISTKLVTNTNNFCKELEFKLNIKSKVDFDFISNIDFSNMPLQILPFLKFEEGNKLDSNNCSFDASNDEIIYLSSFLIICEDYLPILTWSVFNEKYQEIEVEDKDYIMISDYYFADYNNDKYLDLILNIYEKGNYSAPGIEHKIIISAKEEGKYISLDYSNSYDVIPK